MPGLCKQMCSFPCNTRWLRLQPFRPIRLELIRKCTASCAPPGIARRLRNMPYADSVRTQRAHRMSSSSGTCGEFANSRGHGQIAVLARHTRRLITAGELCNRRVNGWTHNVHVEKAVRSHCSVYIHVLHREIFKGLAPPRNTTKQRKENVQSTQTTVNLHNSQTKQRAPSQKQSTSQVA